MNDFQSSDNSQDQNPQSPTSSMPQTPSESQTVHTATSPVQPQPQPQPQQASFNEQQRWNEIQEKLSQHEQTLKSRVQTSDTEGGIVQDSYQRRMRELRQKLYDDFIKKSLDYHISQQSAGNKVQALQQVLKEQSLLTQQTGRDKVFRDDVVKEVEHRLDSLTNTPFDGAEEKLEALSSLYMHAVNSGANNGGVTENWRKRILREARRKYALSILSQSPEKMERWTQKDSDFARYVKGLMEKEDVPQPQMEQPQSTPVSTPSTTPAPSQPQPQPTLQAAPEPIAAPQSVTPPQPTTPVSPVISMKNDEEVAKTRTEEEQKESQTSVSEQAPVSQPVSPLVEPPAQSTATQQVGTVIPAPDTSSTTPEPQATPTVQKEEEKSEEPKKPEPFGRPMTPSPPTSTPPGQSFSDFLAGRSPQPQQSEEKPAGTVPQPSTQPFSPPTSEVSAPSLQPEQSPSASQPFSPTPETVSTPPQMDQPRTPEELAQPEPEKKKGFLSRLFGK